MPNFEMAETSVFGLPVNPGLSDCVAGKSQPNADIQNH